jgi:hypothetical protein
MQLPEKVVAGTHNTELEFKRRLKSYDDLGDDANPGKFFEDVDRPGETISKNICKDYPDSISIGNIQGGNGRLQDSTDSKFLRSLLESRGVHWSLVQSIGVLLSP